MRQLRLGSPNPSSSHLPPAPLRPRRTHSEAVARINAILGTSSRSMPVVNNASPSASVDTNGDVVVRTGTRTITFAATMTSEQRQEVLRGLLVRRKRRDNQIGSDTITQPGATVQVRAR